MVGTPHAGRAWSTCWREDGLRRRYRVRLSAHEADVNGPEGQSMFALRTEDDLDERGASPASAVPRCPVR